MKGLIIAVALAALGPQFAILDSSGSAPNQVKPFSPGDVTWTQKTHTFTQTYHQYLFHGDWRRLAFNGKGDTWTWHYAISATGSYDPKLQSFRSTLTVTVTSMLENGQPYQYIPSLQNCIQHARWSWETTGKYVEDPWLNYYPGIQLTGVHTRPLEQGGHCGAESPVQVFLTLDIPPMVSFTAFTGPEQGSLQDEARNAPWPPCHTEISDSIPRIVSPRENQLFTSGNVQLYFEMPCRFARYDKNAFFVRLERRVSNPGATHEVWQPVSIPSLPYMGVKMKPSMVPHELRSFGDAVVRLHFDEGYALLRMKVKAIVWQNGGFQETNVQQNWRHFRVGNPSLKPNALHSRPSFTNLPTPTPNAGGR